MTPNATPFQKALVCLHAQGGIGGRGFGRGFLQLSELDFLVQRGWGEG